MTRHSYTPIHGPPEQRATIPGIRARDGLACFGVLAALVFALAYWPGAPLPHGLHAGASIAQILSSRPRAPPPPHPWAPAGAGAPQLPWRAGAAQQRRALPPGWQTPASQQQLHAAWLQDEAAAPPAPPARQQPQQQAQQAQQGQQQQAQQAQQQPKQQQKQQGAKKKRKPRAAAPPARPAGAAARKQPLPQQQPSRPAAAAHPAGAGAKPAKGFARSAAPPGKVLVELYVSSMCPDSGYCARHFDRLLARLQPITHVRAHYIQFNHGGRFICPHGDGECAGNLHQLCVQKHVPQERNRDWFVKFLVCAWEGGAPRTSKEAVTRCLGKVGAPGALRPAVGKCIAGAEGKKLMRKSAAAAAAAGAVRSCTVAVEGRKTCIRSGGSWSDCPGGASGPDFKAAICDAYTAKYGRAPPAGACGERPRQD